MEGYEALSEKEKQTLRLLLAGHDAKSMARHFDLSIHTVNERLRDARRKLSVSSSREAARLLHQREGAAPESLGAMPFGAAGTPATDQRRLRPQDTARSSRRAARVIGGLAMLTILLAAIAVLAPSSPPRSGVTAQAPNETAAGRAARDFLTQGDAGNWEAGYAATTSSFRALNTLEAWRSASQRARVPLGRVLTRTLVSEEDTPAPPNGYRTVRFRTDFANRRGATETLSLERDGDQWKVAGVYIE